MRLTSLLLTFCTCLSTTFLFSQVITVNYDSDKTRAKFDGMNLGDIKLKETEERYKYLRWHYRIRSDGQQVVCTLDSITQKCGLDASSTYAFKRIQIKDENGGWLKYGVLDNIDSTKTVYRIGEKNYETIWEVDYKNHKNILGYSCFKATAKNDDDKWVWICLDIPFNLSPLEQLDIPGVVLEYVDGSTRYVAQKVEITNDKLIEFDPEIYDVVKCKDFSDFAPRLMNPENKLSVDMFDCRSLD